MYAIVGTSRVDGHTFHSSYAVNMEVAELVLEKNILDAGETYSFSIESAGPVWQEYSKDYLKKRIAELKEKAKQEK